MNPTLRTVRTTVKTACRCAAASNTPQRRLLATVVPVPNAATSSAGSSNGWRRPIPEGLVPAYDEALNYIRDHSARTQKRADELQARLEKEGVNLQDSSSEAVRELEALRVAAEINLPEVLWEFQNGQGDLSRPVHRHLREKVWRQEGALSKVIERVRLQRVVPDVVPRVEPTVDLQVFYGQGEGIGDHGGEGGEVLTGVIVGAHKTLATPTVVATPFHAEERLYTLIMLDPDMPVPETQSYGVFAHWLVTDIPLSFTKNTLTQEILSRATLPYLPPHPAQGTSKHRYVTLLFEQPSSSVTSSGGPTPERVNFDLKSYLTSHNLLLPSSTPDGTSDAHLSPVHAAGIHFFRSLWTSEPHERSAISRVWTEMRGLPEPAYGDAPRVDRLKDERGEKPSRYF